ncbi:MAG: RepB family plasmid replication initiator protein, partial [Chloroflexia bacterium]|nr:RepB family plasmid replication initiator protein [Chloroflexia bacterium]
LRQHKALGKREFDIDELKAKIGLAGLYDRVGNLKVRVIDPAMREINETSDIMCEYEQRKRGRKVTGFLFLIRDNQRTKSPREKIRAAAQQLDDGANKAPDLAKLLREEYRVSATQARQLANMAVDHEDAVRARLPKLKARYEKLKEKKTSLGGYVFMALKDELTVKQRKLPI